MKKYKSALRVDIDQLRKSARFVIKKCRGRNRECLKKECMIPNVGDSDLSWADWVREFGQARTDLVSTLLLEEEEKLGIDPNFLQIAILAEFVK